MIGISGSERGQLRLTKDSFSFEGEKGTRFDVPHRSVTAVRFPWYYLGGGMKVTVGTETYRFSFVEPHNEYASIGDGRATGAKWRTALEKVVRNAA